MANSSTPVSSTQVSSTPVPKTPMSKTPTRVSPTRVSPTCVSPTCVSPTLAIKKSQKEINKEKVARYLAKNNKMVTGQFFIYGLRGKREMPLTWKVDVGDIHSLTVKHGDTITIPFGYAKYLNKNGSVKRINNTGLALTDNDGNKMPIKAEDDEKRYEFRPTMVLSAEEMLELDPYTIVKASV